MAEQQVVQQQMNVVKTVTTTASQSMVATKTQTSHSSMSYKTSSSKVRSIRPSIIWDHDVMTWTPFSHYCPFVGRIRLLTLDFLHKGPAMWSFALMFSLLLLWTNCWTNNRVVGDLRHHDAHFTSLWCNVFRGLFVCLFLPISFEILRVPGTL